MPPVKKVLVETGHQHPSPFPRGISISRPPLAAPAVLAILSLQRDGDNAALTTRPPPHNPQRHSPTPSHSSAQSPTPRSNPSHSHISRPSPRTQSFTGKQVAYDFRVTDVKDGADFEKGQDGTFRIGPQVSVSPRSRSEKK